MEMEKKLLTGLMLVSVLFFVTLSVAKVYADYVGPATRTTTTGSCDEIIRNYDDAYICSFPKGGSNYDHCGDHCGSPSNVDCASVYCDAIRNDDPLYRVESQSTTITLPNATASGTFHCNTPGNNGWCRGGASLVFTANEPVDGYVISAIETDLWGYVCQPNTASPTCTHSPGDGAGTVTFWAESTYGDSSTQHTLSWKLDTKPPVITPSVPAPDGQNGWYVTEPQIDASGSDATSGLALLQCRVDGGEWQNPPVSVTGDGTHTVDCQAQDNAGNTTTWSDTVKVDTTAPTANPATSGTMGDNGWYISTVTVRANASDAASGVARVEHKVDGGEWEDGDSVTLGDGVHTVVFRVTDNAGNVTTTAAQTVKVDATAPVLTPSVPAPDGQNGWYVTEPQMDASGSDATSGLALLQCRVDGGEWQNPPVSVTGDGTHTVDCQAQDNAGNTTTWSDTVKVDTTLPTLTPSVPAPDGQNGWYVTEPQIDASGSDATSGLALLQCRVDSGEWQTPPVSVTGDGTHTVDCQAQDNAGNTATWSDTVKVDTTAPVSAFTAPTEGATVSGVVTLQGVSKDITSGTAAVEVSTDNGKGWKSATLEASSDRWTVLWDTRSLPDGTYTLLARARDEAGNEEHTAVLHIVVANAPPEVSLRPGQWYFWQTARADITPNPYIPLKAVTVSVLGPAGYVRRWHYGAVQHVDIHWNARWYSENGVWARPGEYRVVVDAVDIYGHAGSAEGTVIVPQPVLTATSTPTATLTPTSTPTPITTTTPVPTATAPLPTATATPTQPPAVSQPTAAPTIAPPPSQVKSGKNSLAKAVPMGVVGGILALLAGALIADPRPKPTRELANALNQINRYLEHKKEE